jgi:hypothetical protein
MLLPLHPRNAPPRFDPCPIPPCPFYFLPKKTEINSSPTPGYGWHLPIAVESNKVRQRWLWRRRASLGRGAAKPYPVGARSETAWLRRRRSARMGRRPAAVAFLVRELGDVGANARIKAKKLLLVTMAIITMGKIVIVGTLGCLWQNCCCKKLYYSDWSKNMRCIHVPKVSFVSIVGINFLKKMRITNLVIFVILYEIFYKTR